MVSSDLLSSILKFFAEHFIHHLRAGLALRRFHHLADEKAEDFFVAASVLRDLLRVSRSHPSAGLFMFSKTGRRQVVTGNFEFSAAEPPKQIPIT